MNHGNVSKEIASGLLALRKRFDAQKPNIPSSKLDESVNVATWNIRMLGKSRTEAAVHYIAEIIGQFDLVGVVEVRDDITDLSRVLNILGPYWRAVYSDAITDPGGNDERFAFVYDKRAVTFNGLAAEADAPREKQGDEWVTLKSFWRNPYMASFRSGSFDFVAIIAHARWGDDNVVKRAEELERLADWVEEKRQSKYAEDKDVFLMGDFNIPSLSDETFKALTKNGLRIPTALAKNEFGTNLVKDKRYDQILHHPIYPESFTKVGGVLDFYGNGAIVEQLFPAGMTKPKFINQLSDHLPLWIQVNTDTEGLKLDQIIKG